jgi:uncharacterized protein YbjT (DUF2867 family)
MRSDEGTSKLILLTGATGYVGGHLLAALREDRRSVRCLARRPERLKSVDSDGIQVVKGDVLDPISIRQAMEGVDSAYYLVHSMAGEGSFEERDREAAQNFSKAAAEAGVGRIIYLGGLARGEDLSGHLSSRLEVGEILRASSVPTIELRASVIIGSGSLSFEVVRALVNRLPLMVTPRWVSTRSQPIAINDVISYLKAALEIEVEGSCIFEIGGADTACYMDIMTEYARQRGLRRLFLPVPVLTPWLSSLWLGLVTPVLARIGRRLIEGVRNESVVSDSKALTAFPIEPMTMSEAIREALREED